MPRFCQRYPKLFYVFFLLASMSWARPDQAGETAQAASPRIMLIGDSITEGRGSDDGIGYRKVLFDLLQSISLSSDFVGSYGDSPYEGHFQGSRKIFDFYPPSLNHGGTGVMDVTADMDAFHPTLVAIHLGTNGFTTNTDQMITLIKYLLTWHSAKGNFLQHIVVSQIIPMEENDSSVVVFNTKIAKMVQDFQKGYLTGQAEPVFLCDHFSRFVENPLLWVNDWRTLMADNLHPSANGHALMGKSYAEVMVPLLSGVSKWFSDVTWKVGVAGLDHRYGGQGLAMADINQDGKDDLYLSRIASASAQNRHLFFVSNDTLPYPEVAETWQVKDYGASRGALFFDYDNDGDWDLFNAHSPGQNILLQNYQNRYFRDVTTQYGIQATSEETASVLAFDAERDGDLDLFVLNMRAANEFYLNDGKGYFSRKDRGCNDVYESNSEVARLSAAAADFDNDGDIDIYVVKRNAANKLYINNGAGSFSDEAAEWGVNLNHKANGAYWSDLDNDGDLDLLVTLSAKSGDSSPLLRVYQNNGGNFLDVSTTTAIPMNGYSILIADFDNDGLQDIITTHESGSGAYYKNDGALRFRKINDTGAEVYAGDVRSAVPWDVDNDGNMDIFFNRADAFNVLRRNTLSNANHYLKIKAIGPKGSLGGFGSKLWCYQAGELANPAALLGFREIMTANGHLTQGSPTQHFGLGTRTRVDVLALFTDGTIVTVRDVAADQMITLQPNPAASGSGTPTQLIAQTGQNQSAVVGQALADPLTAKLLDAKNLPVANVRVDFSILSGDAQLILPTASSDAIWLEAELGGLAGAMRWSYDDQCSGRGLVLLSPLAPAWAGDTLRFQINKAGNYYAWLRAFNPTSVNPNLRLRMDGGSKEAVTISELSGWQWLRVRVNAMDRVYTLSSGGHTLLLEWDQASLQIDRVLLTADAYYTPTALGDQGNSDPLATDQNGLTWRRVQLGSKAGPLTVEARATGSPSVPALVFHVQALAGKATNLVEISGNHQAPSKKGEKLALPFVVAVRDAFANPVAGKSVRFKVIAGGGTLTPVDGQTITDSNGQARAFLTLGGISSLQRVSAETDSVINSPVIFEASVAGLATEIRLLEWSVPTDTVKAVLTKPMQVYVLNDSSKPAAAFPVKFRATQSGHVSATQSAGSDTSITLYTNAEGKAQVWWQLPTRSGEQFLIAEAPGLAGSPLSVKAVALPGRPVSLLAVAGDRQQAPVTKPLQTPFQVRVLDAYGNPVANQSVLFKVKAGDGSLSGATQRAVLSDANGIASAQFTVGTKSGDANYSVEASASFAASSVLFLAGATPGPASLLMNLSPTQLSGVIGMPLQNPIQVRVMDAYQNPVAGLTVQFTVSKGDGKFGNNQSSQNIVSDRDGLAAVTYQVGSLAGKDRQQVQALAPGLTPSQFIYSISAMASRPALLTIISGQNQFGSVFTRLAEPLVVRVTDAYANPVVDHLVQFNVISAGGTLQGDRNKEVLTDSIGLAQVYLVLNAERGDSVYVVEAASHFDGQPLNNSPVRFYASTLQATPVRLFPITNPTQWLTGFAYQEADQPVKVQVIDESGRGVANVAVMFKVTVGSGSFLPDKVAVLQVYTDAEGRAQARYVLGGPGTNNALSVSAFNGTEPLGNSPIIYQAVAQSVTVHMELVSTATPMAVVDHAPSEAVKVKIVDLNGAAVANQKVRFQITKGNGRLVANSDSILNTTSLSDGTASAAWRLGTEAGKTTQQLQISAYDDAAVPIAGSPIVVTANALADAPNESQSQLSAVSPAFIGEKNGSAIILTVKDKYGNRVPQRQVSLIGSGVQTTLIPASGFTDSLGVFASLAKASVSGEWTVTARDVLSATALGKPGKVQFLEPAAASIIAIGTTTKTGVVGDTLKDPLQVRVRDGLGNVLSGTAVEFVIVQGDANFVASGSDMVDYRIESDLTKLAEVLTDETGKAQVKLVLGTRSGLVRVVCRPKNVNMQLTFEVRAQADLPALMQKISGDQQSGVAGHRLNQPLIVRLLDIYGNPVAGHGITFTGSSSGAKFLPAGRVTTDSLGSSQVLWYLGLETGLQQIQAIADGLEQAALFVANATPNSKPILKINDAYSIKSGELFTLTIEVQDAEMDTISVTAADLPKGSTLKGFTFSWKPDNSQSGNYAIQFIAQDHLGAFSSKSVAIQVVATNRRPIVQNELTSPKQRDLGVLRKSGTIVDFTMSATDPDGDPVFYSWLVNGLFKTATSYYRFQADGFSVGGYTIQAIASDGKDTTSVTWRLQLITAVVLNHFTGQYQPYQGVTLHWQTRAEIDHVGFYVLRSLHEQGPYEPVSSLILPTPDGCYSFSDNSRAEQERLYYRLQDIASDGTSTEHDPIQVTLPLPTDFDLAPNFPNPFNSATTISWQIPKREGVTLQIVNVTGQVVAALCRETKNPGFYTVTWDGKDDLGKEVAAGIYYCVLSSRSVHLTRKMVLLR